MSELSPEAAKVLAARKSAVEELKTLDGIERPINDHLVMRLAGARLYAEGVTLRVVNGEPVTASEFKAANDMVEAAREVAASHKPIQVQLTIVRRAVDDLTDEQGKPLRTNTPKLLPAPDVIEGEIVTDGPSSVEQASNDATADVPARPAAPVYPRRDPGSIHDAPGARMRRTDYCGINAGGVYSPLEKAPDWSAAHPLPLPPPERLK